MSAVAPGPGRSPFASTVALKDGGMQKALTRVALCARPSARQTPAGAPKSVISCSEPGLDDAEPKAPDVRCRQVVHAAVPGQPVRPEHCAFEVQATAG